jgi:hypothetical protein
LDEIPLDLRTDVLYNGFELRLPIVQVRKIIVMASPYLKNRIVQALIFVPPSWTSKGTERRNENG